MSDSTGHQALRDWFSIGVSFATLVFLVIVAFVGWQFAYKERITVRYLPSSVALVHLESMIIPEFGDPRAHELSMWRKIFVANNANKPFSIVEVVGTATDQYSYDLSSRLYEEVSYANGHLQVSKPVELPMYLPPSSSVIWYALIPFPIVGEHASSVLEIFRDRRMPSEIAETVLYSNPDVLFQMLHSEGPGFLFARFTEPYWYLQRVVSTGAIVTRNVAAIRGFGTTDPPIRDGIQFLPLPVFNDLVASAVRKDLFIGNPPEMLPFKHYKVSIYTNTDRVSELSWSRHDFPIALHWQE